MAGPMRNQEGLFPVDPPKIDLDRRRAFGSVPSLLNCGDVHAPSYAAERLVDVASLQTVLYSQSLGDTAGYVVDGLALNSGEYNDLARNPKMLLRAVGASTVTSRLRRGDESVDRIGRKDVGSQLSTIKSKIKKHDERIAQFTREVEKLLQLEGVVHSPGYARMKEIDLRLLATEVWTTSFSNIIQVAVSRRKWDGSTVKLAMDAMTYRLTNRASRDRVGYWQDMSALAFGYADNKRMLFKLRKNSLQSEREKLENESHAQNEAFLRNEQG